MTPPVLPKQSIETALSSPTATTPAHAVRPPVPAPPPSEAPPAPARVVARLPLGIRDWLPPEARRRAGVGAQLLQNLELFGYDRVGIPPFEHADVLEGIGGAGTEGLRFVEPDTGELVALRSDVTPQVARLVASRMSEGPWPVRLGYQATVLRRRRERARLDRQIRQVGFELVGSAGPAGDLEVLEAAATTLRAAGVQRFTVDLAHAAIAGSLLKLLPAAARPELLESLAVKDGQRLHGGAKRAGLRGRELQALTELPELYGKEELWARAEPLLAGTPAEGPFQDLRSLWSSAMEAQLAPDVVVDLGETREFFYYTGFMFHLLAEGPGEPLGSGGRYDTLFDRYGMSLPAAGFAFDVSNVCWALDACGQLPPAHLKVLVVGSYATDALLRALRARRIPCAIGPADDPRAYGTRHGFSHLLTLDGPSPALTDLGGGREPLDEGQQASAALGRKDPEALAEVVATRLTVLGEPSSWHV